MNFKLDVFDNSQDRKANIDYRLDLATRSSSSFFLIAYELDDPCKKQSIKTHSYIINSES